MKGEPYLEQLKAWLKKGEENHIYQQRGKARAAGKIRATRNAIMVQLQGI